MIAMPSASTAMMNVSRNWPSGIKGFSRSAGSGVPGSSSCSGSRFERSGFDACTHRTYRTHCTRRRSSGSGRCLRSARLGSTAASASDRDSCSGRSCSSGTAPFPMASATACLTASWTNDWSRNRTSAFVGCTFTSTRSAGMSRNRWTSGLRSLMDALL